MRSKFLLLLFVSLSLANNDRILEQFDNSHQKLLQSTSACVGRIEDSNDYIKNRFSKDQLSIACAKQKAHDEDYVGIARRASGQADPSQPLTNRQRDWLNQLRSCDSPVTCIASDMEMSRRQKRQSRQVLRREYRALSDAERTAFHDAVQHLKTDTIDGRSKYDLVVHQHTPAESPGAHWGPAFLPWHREFLRQFEVALRRYNSSVALPYWDSTLDSGLPDPRDSILWSSRFLGNGRGYLRNGPFAAWKVTHAIGEQDRIRRDYGDLQFGSLYTEEDVDHVLQYSGYPNLTMCVDPFFELMHGAVHNWVGGHMADIPISVNDPSFFLLHSYVDLLWERFRQARQAEWQRHSEYPRTSDACSSHHHPGEAMKPFTKRNIDGLSADYTEKFYQYAFVPDCTYERPQCGSPYLFCQWFEQKCYSKIVPGGNCTGFAQFDICFESRCVEGICVSKIKTPLPDQPVISQRPQVIRPDLVGPPGPPAPRTTTIRPYEQVEDNHSCVCPQPQPLAPPKCPSNVNFHHKEEPSTLWMPVTIRKGLFNDQVPKSSPQASLITLLLDSSGNVLAGKNLDVDHPISPFYQGAALLQLPKTNKAIDIKFQVRDADGDCDAYCRTPAGYVPCGGMLTLDPAAPRLSYTAYEAHALYLTWDGTQLVDTEYLFMCRPKTTVTTLQSASFDPDKKKPEVLRICKFMRFDGFALYGHSTYSQMNVSRDECKEICRAVRTDDTTLCTKCSSSLPLSAICESVMYFKSTRECILSSASRHTKPDLFAYSPTDTDAIYMDYVCDVEELFA